MANHDIKDVVIESPFVATDSLLEAIEKENELTSAIQSSLEQSMLDGISLVLPDGSATYVGMCINVLEASGPNSECTKSPLFIKNVYRSDDYIETNRVNLAVTASQVSEKFAEVFHSTEIEAKVKTGAALAFFTGEISAKYGNSSKLTSNARFYNAVASVETQKHMLDSSYVFGEAMREIVKPDILKYIDNPTIAPSRLFSAYGTHIITEASIGGCIEVHGIYNSESSITNTQFKAAVDVACAYVSASASTSLTNEQKKIVSDTTISAKSYGGNVSVVAGMHSFSEIGASFKAWADSIRANENQVLAKVYSYMPIWELAEKPERQQEIMNDFINFARGRFTFVSEYFKIQEPLTPPKPVALSVLAFGMRENKYIPGYIGFLPRAEHNTYASVYSNSVNGLNKFDMITNSDGTVSFRASDGVRYLTVHYNSFVPESIENWVTSRGDLNQLFVLATPGGSISNRQKFVLEKSGSGHKFKWIPENKPASEGKYLAGRLMPAPPSAACTLFFVDANADSAIVVNIKDL